MINRKFVLRLILPLFFLTCCFVISRLSTPIPDTAVSYTGTIIGIGEQRITVEYEEDYIASITILPSTKIYNQNGSSIDLSELVLETEIVFIVEPTVIYDEPERFPTCYKITLQ